MIKEKKSLKGKSPSRRKFFKAAAATGVAAVAASSLAAPAVAMFGIATAAAATAPALAAVLKNLRLEDVFIFNDLFSFVIITPIKS